MVATPLGTARDITLRALDILANADVIAAEDSRTARKLLDIHGIPLNGRAVKPYHDHSRTIDRERLLADLAAGKSVAYVSEAGTPMIADPGYQLVKAAQEAGHYVTAAPGPSAVINALVVSGMPTDQFHFLGFLPSTGAARRRVLGQALAIPATLVIFESAKRMGALLADLCTLGAADRDMALCREMTKKFEEVLKGPAHSLQSSVAQRPLKGELVVLIDRQRCENISESEIKVALVNAMLTMRVKDAVRSVAEVYGKPKRDIYQMALQIKKDGP